MIQIHTTNGFEDYQIKVKTFGNKIGYLLKLFRTMVLVKQPFLPNRMGLFFTTQGRNLQKRGIGAFF